MIGSVMRGMAGAQFVCRMICLPITGLMALCGLHKYCFCKMRDSKLCKLLLRWTTDPYDDFDLMVLVHEASYTAKNTKRSYTTNDKSSTYVRVRAGREVCDTDKNSSGVYQQGISIQIEQGSQYLEFDLMCNGEAVATLQIKVWEDVLNEGQSVGNVVDKTYDMEVKNKAFLNPTLKLTFSPDGDEEKALVSGLNIQDHTSSWMLKQHLRHCNEDYVAPKVEAKRNKATDPETSKKEKAKPPAEVDENKTEETAPEISKKEEAKPAAEAEDAIPEVVVAAAPLDAKIVDAKVPLQEDDFSRQESVAEPSASVDTRKSKAPQVEQPSEIMMLAKGCCGPLELFSFATSKENHIYVAVTGPPSKKKYSLDIWPSEDNMTAGNSPAESIELLRLSAVYADPKRSDVFALDFVDNEKIKRKKTFRRLDRPREVWVELLQVLVTKVHQERKEQKLRAEKKDRKTKNSEKR